MQLQRACGAGTTAQQVFVEQRTHNRSLSAAGLQVYDVLDRHISCADTAPQPAATFAPSPAAAAAAAPLRPRDLLRCISSLASLKYSMPGRLQVLLESGPAGGRAGLAGLRMQQLAALAGSLARAGVRPSNVWLVGLMQVGRMQLLLLVLLFLQVLLCVVADPNFDVWQM
jgi:hypothetical protein